MQIRQFENRTITAPGLYANVPIDGEYGYHTNPFLCDGPSISSTGLKEFIERPSLYWAFSPYNRDAFTRPGGAHFGFGQAAHILLLEGGEGFERRFAIRPEKAPDGRDWNGNNKTCRAWLESVAAEGRTVITANDLKTISAIRDNLDRNPFVRGGILDGLTETSAFCRVPSRNNIWLRARPDKVPPHSGDVADLKTTASIAYDDIERDIYKRGYFIQAGLVKMVLESVIGDGWQFQGYALIFVEKTPPYDVRIVQLREEDIDLGEKLVRSSLQYFDECISRWDWPGEEGFSASIDYAGIPAWARTRIENLIEYRKMEAAE